MSDFGNDEVGNTCTVSSFYCGITSNVLQYPNMVCVEAGYVSEPYNIPAGEKFQASQLLEVL